ncbi:MAG: hypothetical protein E7D92_04580 [Anaerococcus sp.]|uniref:hypothetical protein n=1 Tax=Anaerococcus sp. TaxID=1872515 RepID=UPI00290374EA|nr:hypothetical protein [Anaerococcus sp.]MDU2353855.1 hypothetical protein [Anaerococcus sp.]
MTTYNNVLEFFYKKMSDRVRENLYIVNKDRKKNHKLPIRYIDISNTQNEVVGFIIKNKRIYNKNRYLIPDKIAEGMVKKLNFENKNEIIWGSEYEIKSYSCDLFINIVNDITDNNKGTDLYDKLESILEDYYYYALTKFSLSFQIEMNIFLEYTNFEPYLNERFMMFDDDLTISKLEAILRLYYFIQDDFLKSLYNLSNRIDTTSKFENTITNYIENDFMKLLDEYEFNNIPGHDLHNIMLEGLKFVKNNLTIDNFKNNINNATLNEDEKNNISNNLRDTNIKYVYNTMDYVYELMEIQRQVDERVDIANYSN